MKTDDILKQVLERVKPTKEELSEIKKTTNDFLGKFKKQLKKLKIKADVFIGGSDAKGTLIKKGIYDVDVFVRFDKRIKNISEVCERVLKSFVKKYTKIHGSRDYFKIDVKTHHIELVPVIKIKNFKEAENITDLSYSHVKYVKRKMKGKILDDIRLAKAFCYANNCYGAESYIQGFSGYALELLVYHYKGFLKFIRAMAKAKDKIVIDIEKTYKNKKMILMDLNASKLQSPIILIDPTFKQRNVAAALSDETFDKFKKSCKSFLKSPSIKEFEKKKTDLEKVKKNALKKKFEFILLEAKTDRQEGDIAGSKLLKFSKHLEKEIGKFFDVKNKGFNYNNRQSSRFFFVVKSKKELLIQGPNVKDLKNVKRFKKEHRHCFVKCKRVFSREKIIFTVNDFVKNWKVKNKNKIREMGMTGFSIARS